MDLGTFLGGLRKDENLGLRELCGRVQKHRLVKDPISPAYLSRLERGGADHILVDKVSLDKLWGVGVALQVCPLLLFVLSRPSISRAFLSEVSRDKMFDVFDVPDAGFGLYLRTRRHDLSFTLGDVSLMSKGSAAEEFWISPSFLSQVETDHRGMSSRISGEKLWSLGVVLRVDPLALFVLSRNLDAGLHERKRRRSLFSRFSV